MPGGVRPYQFDVGAETPNLPTSEAPVSDFDFVRVIDLLAGAFNAPSVSGTRAAPNSIVAGTGISLTTLFGATNKIKMLAFVQGSGGAVNISANPQIQAGTIIGQELTLIGCHAANTVTLEHGDGLIMNGPYTLDAERMIVFTWDGTIWVERNRQ